MSNLQTYNQFKLDFQKCGPINREVVNPRHPTPQGQTVAAVVEYPNKESKYVIKESEDNMFNGNSVNFHCDVIADYIITNWSQLYWI